MYIYKQHERSLLAMKCAVIFVSKKSYQVQYFVVIVCAIFIFVLMSRTKPCQVPNTAENDLVKLNVHFKSTNRLDCLLFIYCYTGI